MKIKLITPELYNELLTIQTTCKVLTFQNKGYEYIDKSKFNDYAKKSFTRVTEILKNHIVGFSEFNNFQLNKNNEIKLRFQYNWGAEDDSMYFIGVGYILLSELLNGFNESEV